MEEVLERVKVETNTHKKKFTIFGISIYKILVYFIIYSILGYIVETLYAILTKGVWESRQSFLYGPFCGIYGLGAVVLILALQYFNTSTNKLFIGGFIVGSIVEYVVSLVGELIFHVKWWDYSQMPLNINGRICIYFSIFWGFLAVYFMTSFHPKIEKFINKIEAKKPMKVLKITTILVTVFLLFDFLITTYALKVFVVRKVHDYDLNVENKEYVINDTYNKVYGNEKMANFIYKYFSDEKMIKTFPNLKIQDVDGNILYLNQYVGDIQPYYWKFFEKKDIHINENAET